MTTLQDAFAIVLIGCGATLVMDAWLLFLKRLGVQTLNFAFIGRWAGHVLHGRFAHAAIGQTPPIPHELALGWLVHYAVGIAFAAALVTLCGTAWVRHPTWAPALLFGLGTVAAPLFVMQPAMGAGFAASRTPAPLQNCLKSLATHTVFGTGLFLSASVVAWVSR